MTITATGTCATSRAARYSKQLVSHMSRRHGGEWDSEADRGYILFPTTRADLKCTDDMMTITVEAEDEETATFLEDVIERHLVKFGAKDNLTMEWTRS